MMLSHFIVKCLGDYFKHIYLYDKRDYSSYPMLNFQLRRRSKERCQYFEYISPINTIFQS